MVTTAGIGDSERPRAMVEGGAAAYRGDAGDLMTVVTWPRLVGRSVGVRRELAVGLLVAGAVAATFALAPISHASSRPCDSSRRPAWWWWGSR